MPASFIIRPAAMIDRVWLDDLTDRISRVLPKAGELGSDLRTTLRQVLQSSLERLDILTREEFEGQLRALERAEQRITELEARVRELEKERQADPF